MPNDGASTKLAWVTGAHGFIGRHLSRALSDSMNVAGIGHGQWTREAAQDWGVSRWLNGDINAANLAALERDGGAPGTIYHLAGGSSVPKAREAPHEDFQRTVATTVQLMAWNRARANRARIVLVSSAAVYGSGHDGPIAEGAAVAPVSIYGHHKAMMETIGRYEADEFGQDIAIARLFSVYGPHLRKQLIWDICTRLAQGETTIELGGTGADLRDWTEVTEVARALAALGSSAQRGTINLGSGQATSVADIARLILDAWRSDAPLRFSGRSRPGDPPSLIADTRALANTGFAFATPPSTGIAATVDWFIHARGDG